MLAFTCFWTYIAFSQLLLIWIAGLPEETPFYITRFKPGWAGSASSSSSATSSCRSALLLSRTLKRNPRGSSRVAVWILLIHYVDIYWLVMPALYPDGFAFHWTNLTAFAGRSVCWRSRSRSRACGASSTVPVRIPTSLNR